MYTTSEAMKKASVFQLSVVTFVSPFIL